MTALVKPPPATVYDNLLGPKEQSAIWAYLNLPGWSFGGYSADGGDRYLYKHFAGFVADGREQRTAQAIEDELMNAAPLIGQLWHALKAGPLKGAALARCYANGMTGGVEGGLHLDSNIPTHLTSIYYPHPTWEPNFGGRPCSSTTAAMRSSRPSIRAPTGWSSSPERSPTSHGPCRAAARICGSP